LDVVPILVRDRGFAVDGQFAARNAAWTAGGLADPNDGESVDLSHGAFAYAVEVLPSVEGRNRLQVDWTLFYSSRATSAGGWFGATPATLPCMTRVARESGALVLYDEHMRRVVYDLPTNGGFTAEGHYGVMREAPDAVTLRLPDGTRHVFRRLDGSFVEGALVEVRNRFGDVVMIEHDRTSEVPGATTSSGSSSRPSTAKGPQPRTSITPRATPTMTGRRRTRTHPTEHSRASRGATSRG
jgi:hypothetical protein